MKKQKKHISKNGLGQIRKQSRDGQTDSIRKQNDDEVRCVVCDRVGRKRGEEEGQWRNGTELSG